MPIYHTLGRIPRKRHIAFRKPDGGIYAEELVGHEGFTGTASLLYHIHPPTTVKSARRVRETKFEADPDQTLRHRHFLTSRVKKGAASRSTESRCCSIRTSRCSTSSRMRTTLTSIEMR